MQTRIQNSHNLGSRGKRRRLVRLVKLSHSLGQGRDANRDGHGALLCLRFVLVKAVRYLERS